MLSQRALIATAPVDPDFFSCHVEYGRGIAPADCEIAGGMLSQGATAVNYYLNDPIGRMPNQLPLRVTHGTCSITVEVAGPTFTRLRSIPLIPDDIRAMAGYVINGCAVGFDGWGGFITHGLGSFIEALRYSGPWLVYRDTSALWFVTVTISGPDVRMMSPGDTDPLVPIAVINQATNIGTPSPNRAGQYHTLDSLNNLALLGMGMRRGSSQRWWQRASSTPDEMTYVCDSKLGSPAVVDCAQLRWHGLGYTSDTVQTGPGLTKFFSSDSCNLAISATVAITLTWTQIQTALDTLMNVCVDHPLKPPRGGRAFFGPQSFTRPHLWGKRDTAVSGLNALPPHANLTIFTRQGAPTVECELAAAQAGKSVSSCGKA